ncbi:uncharacterized protein K489DRAFT_25044 [Dissoconium aciculare CBS 342.82]|uniref:Uncharacterized protein n=1 Tax=Dissoconium aciculare CBS 342.82 TaxID=1314786 RepID=A0A6J3MIH8_9PEZI|nr:uncharacterized protein K489DRAFT_25044 [Dissoconium aciculare CBS 342.82]KAF1827708.1 hypothetical protein K489DRAFT_25044 [Dissoconium aciculare CBS 342.82]
MMIVAAWNFACPLLLPRFTSQPGLLASMNEGEPFFMAGRCYASQTMMHSPGSFTSQILATIGGKRACIMLSGLPLTACPWRGKMHLQSTMRRRWASKSLRGTMWRLTSIQNCFVQSSGRIHEISARTAVPSHVAARLSLEVYTFAATGWPPAPSPLA